VLSEEIGPFRSGIWNPLMEFTYRIYLDDDPETGDTDDTGDTGDLRGAATELSSTPHSQD